MDDLIIAAMQRLEHRSPPKDGRDALRVDTVGELLRWIDRVGEKARLIGGDPVLTAREAASRAVVLAAVASAVLGEDYSASLRGCRDVDHLLELVEVVLRRAVSRIDGGERISAR